MKNKLVYFNYFYYDSNVYFIGYFCVNFTKI